jgi:glycerol-3-phosphate dehydrogenase
VDRADIVIIGGGVLGCAVARAVSLHWENVFLLEQMPKLGMAASSRNSGVIHSGLYYTPGSLKARHCVAGNRLTYEFCAAHQVPHRHTGKLVVASTPEEETQLAELVERGRANGVEGLHIVDRSAIRAHEPHIAGRAALAVPSTGIVASEELVKAYARVATEQGANILTHARVTRLEPEKDCIRVVTEVDEPDDPERLSEESVEARCLVNAAGLFADEVAGLLGNTRYRIYPVRGEYCELVRSKSHLVNALVYPPPHPEGLSLGVHLTKTLWGTVLVGPTARYVADKNDYERDRLPVEEFARRARLLLPEVAAADLMPAYSGLRAKLVPPGGKGPADFVITRDREHLRAIHLVGIESPGLTAAPSIAQHVAELVAETLG